jgi:hypothetical protein
MDAAHPPHFPSVRRLTVPGVPAWLSTWLTWRGSPATAPPTARVAATALGELDPAALRDIGLPLRGMSARDQAARMLQRAGHG